MSSTYADLAALSRKQLVDLMAELNTTLSSMYWDKAKIAENEARFAAVRAELERRRASGQT